MPLASLSLSLSLSLSGDGSSEKLSRQLASVSIYAADAQHTGQKRKYLRVYSGGRKKGGGWEERKDKARSPEEFSRVDANPLAAAFLSRPRRASL